MRDEDQTDEPTGGDPEANACLGNVGAPVTSDGDAQTGVGPEQTVDEAVTTSAEPKPTAHRPRKARKDKKHLHATHHGILSRYPLEALERLGVNLRSLRRLERQLWAELKPPGSVGMILFDRHWFSYLHCLIAAEHGASILAGKLSDHLTHSVRGEADAPVVVWEKKEASETVLSNDLFQQMVLVQKYDRYYGREMLRTLGMLLILRDGGTTSLAQCVARMVGTNTNPEGTTT